MANQAQLNAERDFPNNAAIRVESGAASIDPMARYRTRERAAVARRIPLLDPATGEQTGDWIEIVSSLSDRFRQARETGLQRAAEAAALPADQRNAVIGKTQAEMRAALVTAWSFDVPCTVESVAAFLSDCPQIFNLVGVIADKGELFFGNASAS